MDINLLINNFIEYEQKLNRSDKTLKLYKTEINLFIKRYNISSINDLKLLENIDFLTNTWIEDMKKEYEPSTINKKKIPLSVFSNYLVLQGITQENKIKSISNIKSDNKKIEVYTDKEIKDIFNLLDKRYIKENNILTKNINLMYKAIFNILYNLALRNEEVTRIKISDINWENGLIYVRCKGGNGEITNKSKMNKETLDIIKQWLQIRNNINIKEGYEDILFISPKSKKGLTTEAIRKHFKEVKKELGINDGKMIHTLRHTKASNLISKGVEIKKVSMFLHHASQNTTEKYYIHNTEQVLEELSEL